MRSAMNYMRLGSWVPISHMCRISFRVHFEFDFRFQLRFYDSPHPHMLPVTPTFPKLLQGTQIRISIYLQRRFIHSRKPLRFQVSIAFLLLRPLTSDSARHFDFRLRFQVSSSRRERTRNRDFDFRFQISDSGEGQKSKSRLRFQISGFRLWRGREIEIETSISISGFDFRRVS